MANLDEHGLGILWTRIRALIDHYLGEIAGIPDRLAVTDEKGGLTARDAFGVRLIRHTVFEMEDIVSEAAFSLDIDGAVLYIETDTGQSEQLYGLDSVMIRFGADAEQLTRRHYGANAAADPCIVFGNTRYTGYGIPVCQDGADTGESCMIFCMDGMFGICLPYSHVCPVWIGTENACISMDGEPEGDTDLVNVRYYAAHMPAAEGTGRNSLRQNVSGTEASGSASFAANGGRAMGLQAFAANDGEASGEHSAVFGSGTTASGRCAAAFGMGCSADGSGAFAEGSNCLASGRFAHAAGQNTIASGEGQMVFGRFNEADPDGQFAEIAGLGRSGERKNGRTLDWNGNEVLSGSLEAEQVILRDENGSRYALSIRSGRLETELLSTTMSLKEEKWDT